MKPRHGILLTGLLLMLMTGCKPSGDGLLLSTTLATAQADTRAATLCVSSRCGEAIPLVTIPDAENILFTPDGRLLVSGGRGVYEVTGSLKAGFTATLVTDKTCNFTGLAFHAGYVYAACGDGRLFAGALATPLQLKPIFTMTGMCIPNGTAFGADGNLYVVDEPLNVGSGCIPPDPKIIRLIIDPADPMHILKQETWLAGSLLGLLSVNLDRNMRFPNGLQVDGRRFYASDGGSIFSVDLLDDGSAGPVTPIYFAATIHDDLGLVNGGILITDFALGRISLISRDGKLLQQTDPLTFSFPSSVRLAQPPMFQPGDILVAEKGILLEMDSPIGNQLTLFRRKAVE